MDTACDQDDICSAVDTLQAYQYKPLPIGKYTRILEVECAATLQDPVRGHLRTVCLDDEPVPKYWTLSYAWGQTFADGSHLTDTIQCDGLPLRITKTLNEAIQHIRQSYSPEPLLEDLNRYWRYPLKPGPQPEKLHIWADAICINQEELAERSSQVLLMPDIYRPSQRLTIWLGRPLSVKDENTFRQLCTHDVCAKLDYFDCQDAILLLRSLSWSNRLWVIQELFHTWQHARYIRFGKLEMKFETLRHLLLVSRAGSILFTHGFLYTPRILVKNLDTPRTLLENLQLFAHAECSEPRDRIYALLSISTDVGQISIQPDYTENVEAIYYGHARQILKNQTSAFKLLVFAAMRRCSKGSTAGMPSWVPEWRLRPRTLLDARREEVERYDFNGECSVREIQDRRLRLDGWILSTCSHLKRKFCAIDGSPKDREDRVCIQCGARSRNFRTWPALDSNQAVAYGSGNEKAFIFQIIDESSSPPIYELDDCFDFYGSLPGNPTAFCVV